MFVICVIIAIISLIYGIILWNGKDEDGVDRDDAIWCFFIFAIALIYIIFLHPVLNEDKVGNESNDTVQVEIVQCEENITRL